MGAPKRQPRGHLPVCAPWCIATTWPPTHAPKGMQRSKFSRTNGLQSRRKSPPSAHLCSNSIQRPPRMAKSCLLLPWAQIKNANASVRTHSNMKKDATSPFIGSRGHLLPIWAPHFWIYPLMLKFHLLCLGSHIKDATSVIGSRGHILPIWAPHYWTDSPHAEISPPSWKPHQRRDKSCHRKPWPPSAHLGSTLLTSHHSHAQISPPSWKPNQTRGKFCQKPWPPSAHLGSTLLTSHHSHAQISPPLSWKPHQRRDKSCQKPWPPSAHLGSTLLTSHHSHAEISPPSWKPNQTRGKFCQKPWPPSTHLGSTLLTSHHSHDEISPPSWKPNQTRGKFCQKPWPPSTHLGSTLLTSHHSHAQISPSLSWKPHQRRDSFFPQTTATLCLSGLDF